MWEEEVEENDLPFKKSLLKSHVKAKQVGSLVKCNTLYTCFTSCNSLFTWVNDWHLLFLLFYFLKKVYLLFLLHPHCQQ